MTAITPANSARGPQHSPALKRGNISIKYTDVSEFCCPSEARLRNAQGPGSKTAAIFTAEYSRLMSRDVIAMRAADGGSHRIYPE
jgi:hypothetical protein